MYSLRNLFRYSPVSTVSVCVCMYYELRSIIMCYNLFIRFSILSFALLSRCCCCSHCNFVRFRLFLLRFAIWSRCMSGHSVGTRSAFNWIFIIRSLHSIARVFHFESHNQCPQCKHTYIFDRFFVVLLLVLKWRKTFATLIWMEANAQIGGIGEPCNFIILFVWY